MFEKKYGTGMVKVSSTGGEPGPINQTTGSSGLATKSRPGRRVGGELAQRMRRWTRDESGDGLGPHGGKTGEERDKDVPHWDDFLSYCTFPSDPIQFIFVSSLHNTLPSLLLSNFDDIQQI